MAVRGAVHGVRLDGNSMGFVAVVGFDVWHVICRLCTCAAAKKIPLDHFPDASCAPITKGCNGTNSVIRVGLFAMSLVSAVKLAMAEWVCAVRHILSCLGCLSKHVACD